MSCPRVDEGVTLRLTQVTALAEDHGLKERPCLWLKVSEDAWAETPRGLSRAWRIDAPGVSWRASGFRLKLA